MTLGPIGRHRGSNAWMRQAACAGVDAELFFPERGEATDAARQICAGCPVRIECLAYALNNGEKHGIWGGKSERERRRMRAFRNREAS